MTLAETLLPPLSERRFVLATDLDGTFLGGTQDDRRRLYDWIDDQRTTIGLIFVTGRDPDFIVELCEERGLPWPEYVVCDVGTSIAEVSHDGTITPIPTLEADIARRWGGKGDAVRAALDGHPGLTLQPTAFRHRVSYDLEADAFCDSAKGKVEELDLDWLISDNRFFDVLPQGVSKGPSLKRLIAHLGVPEGRVLAAGDTLNDLSMLECGLNAVAVGNSEAPLIERVAPLGHVHKARAHGAAGIMEAIDAFSLHDIPKGG
ncbi:hydroxymethylpyrimidine pyrophosphatase-like HAD family hydrolase [Rhodovulum iodosum]|uniref:Hydroxymethylpyrimidine pyrophosphatase-like HAD family hydrolase n=1 Tax=Rhodovulum iodosum TaxID=68291 RepID=A0ABV3XS89_9RHOB|nr:HAD family hydrolase [Rhodovulum robiginosum]RSK30527.1 alpha,alpha-trehalose-phosphate synthase [Rhodovulum robiginosum]